MSESVESAGQAEGVTGRGTTGGTQTFRERLYASWWTWPLPLVAAVLLAAEVHLGHPGVLAWLPYVVLVPLAVAVPVWLGRLKIMVADGEFWAGDAHVALRYVEDAEVISAADKRRALGPDLDPAAFVVNRPWVSTAVRIWLNDANDPTPYWVVSTRRPEELATLLRPS